MSYRYEGLYIMHYGVGHDKGGHSGRYPWGSGEEPYQDLSAAERRKKLLDKHWYHKGAKTRLGVDHIRDVDPNTKLSDLFKYNKRTTSDVLADKVLTYMYGDTEMDREELRRKKYNLMSAITAAEAVAATAVLVGGLSSIKTGMNFINMRLDQKIANEVRNANILNEAKTAARRGYSETKSMNLKTRVSENAPSSIPKNVEYRYTANQAGLNQQNKIMDYTSKKYAEIGAGFDKNTKSLASEYNKYRYSQQAGKLTNNPGKLGATSAMAKSSLGALKDLKDSKNALNKSNYRSSIYNNSPYNKKTIDFINTFTDTNKSSGYNSNASYTKMALNDFLLNSPNITSTSQFAKSSLDKIKNK